MNNWLLHDHRRYEDLIRECEQLAAARDWQATERHLHDLVALLKGHFLMEEAVLFPAYEELVDTPKSPTRHLRTEHDQVRQHLAALSQAMRTQDLEGFLDTFMHLKQVMDVHHEKEEELFLPMAGHALLERRDEVMARLKRIDWKGRMQSWQGAEFPATGTPQQKHPS